MVDQVVDGSQDDGDQPGHNPRPEVKSNYWPDTFAVHLPTRDGQAIPIGAAYQGVIGGSHVYALMTKSVPADPVEPITLDGEDCDGAAVSVTGEVGQLSHVIQAPGTVFKVQLCDNSKDVQRHIMCDPATGHKVAIITDFTEPATPVTSYWDIIAAAPWTGDPLTLEECPDTDIESDSIEMCDDGTTFLRWIIKSNGAPTGEKFDTTLSGQPYTVSDEGTVTVGKCVASCVKAPLGVVNSWAV
jgi:hypothetical protein